MRNGDFLKKTVSNPTGIVGNLMQPNRLGLWASIPGEGKSLIALTMAYHIAYGAPFLDMKATAGNVMIIDSENRYDVLTSRIKKIRKGLELDGYKQQGEIDIQHYSGFLLDNKSVPAWADVANDILAVKPILISADHLAAFHHQDEKSEFAMKKVLEAIEELMQIVGSSVLTLHHFKKDATGTFYSRLRGSSVILAKSDTACEVRALSKIDGRLEKVGLIFQPRKDVTPSPIRIKIEEGSDWLKLVYDGTYKPVEDAKMDKITHDIFHIFLNKPSIEMTVSDVREAVSAYASDREIREALRFCDEQGYLNFDTRQSNKFVYKFSGVPCPWCASP